MVHKSLYVEDKKKLKKYKSDIVDFWEVAGTKQTTEWGGLK